jgi:hypothetical protein
MGMLVLWNILLIHQGQDSLDLEIISYIDDKILLQYYTELVNDYRQITQDVGRITLPQS